MLCGFGRLDLNRMISGRIASGVDWFILLARYPTGYIVTTHYECVACVDCAKALNQLSCSECELEKHIQTLSTEIALTQMM